MAFDPERVCAPLQPPEAVQEVALVEDQVKLELPPLATLVGLALKLTVGGVVATVTVAACDAVPPTPEQATMNLVVDVSADVLAEPLGGSLPDQPPDAAQELALVDDQVNMAVAPLLTVLGLADRVTAGAGMVTETVADCVALPPLPVQVSP